MSIMHFASVSSSMNEREGIKPSSILSTLVVPSPEVLIAEVVLSNEIISATRDTSSGTGTATAILAFTNDGSARSAVNTSGSDVIPVATDYNSTDWWTGKQQTDIGNDYQIFATVTSSSGLATLSGTLDSWTAIGGFSLDLEQTGNNVELTSVYEIQVTIRDIATETSRASANFNMSTVLFGP